MDDLKRITRGGADAQQRLVEIRRKAIETGQVEIHTGTQLVGINDDIAKGWIESGTAAQYAQAGTVRLSGAGNDLIDVLENQVTAQYASIEVAKTHMQLGDAQAAAWLKSTGALANMNMLEQTAAQLLLLHADATNKLGDETETTHDRMVKLVAVTVDLRKAFDAIIGPSLDLESAQRALLDATDATVAALIENGATLDINTVAGRENRDVIQSQVEAMLAQADAMVKNGATTEEATTYALNYRDALINQLEMLGLNEDQVNDYLDVLGLTPENVTTSLAVANKEVVKTQLEEVLSQLTDVDKGAIAAIQADIDEGKFQDAADAINNLPGSHSVVVSLKPDGSSLRISGAVNDFRLQMNTAPPAAQYRRPAVHRGREAARAVRARHERLHRAISPGRVRRHLHICRAWCERHPYRSRRSAQRHRRRCVLPYRELPHGGPMTCYPVVRLEAAGLTPLLLDPSVGVHLAAIDMGDAATREVAQDATDADGTIDTTAYIGARAVTLRLSLFPDTGSAWALRQALRAFTHPRLRPTLFITAAADAPEQQITMRRSQYTDIMDAGQGDSASIVAQWIAPLGIVESAALNVSSIFAAGGATSGRAYSLIPSRVYPASAALGSGVVVNAGNADSYPLLRLTADDEPIITNDTQGKSLAFVGVTLTAGGFLGLTRGKDDLPEWRYVGVVTRSCRFRPRHGSLSPNELRLHPATYDCCDAD